MLFFACGRDVIWKIKCTFSFMKPNHITIKLTRMELIGHRKKIRFKQVSIIARNNNYVAFLLSITGIFHLKTGIWFRQAVFSQTSLKDLLFSDFIVRQFDNLFSFHHFRGFKGLRLSWRRRNSTNRVTVIIFSFKSDRTCVVRTLAPASLQLPLLLL